MTVAVILAAGQGTRLRGVMSEGPKGFLRLGDKPIVQESIERLLAAGIEEIVIVTGYSSGHYETLASLYSDKVRTVHNEKFAESGSMYSLYRARHAVKGEFLLLESDLVYEPRALRVLIEHPESQAILISGPTHAGDEVYVATRDGYLDGMSKDPAELDGEIAGELVGISKISEELFTLMLSISESAFETSLNFDYETDALVAAGKELPIPCPLVDDLIWAEIDDPGHLQRAREDIYPKIKQAVVL
jgi:2-aminoethylphosphonate-pyruvate transaminase